MEYLLGDCDGTLTVSPPVPKKPPKPFTLPPKNDNMRRVYAYLISHRGIDRDVLYTFAHKGMIYEWVFTFGGKIQIISPKDVVEDFKTQLNQVNKAH